MGCQHTNDRLTKKYFNSLDPKISKRFHVCRQCTECGEQVGPNLPNSLVAGRDDIPAFDRDLIKRYFENKRKEWQQQHEEKQRQWRDEYNAYLNSSKWRFTRRMRLEKDKYQCQAKMQGCAVEATDVHHLSYKHFGDEPLFELISVCRSCHNRLHPEHEEMEAA